MITIIKILERLAPRVLDIVFPKNDVLQNREARYVAQHVAAVSGTRRKVRVEFKLPSRDDATKNGASHATK